MKYEITMTKITRDDGIDVYTYGIKYGNLTCFSDVSTNKEHVEKLIYNLNKYHTDVRQLYYIIEDFIDKEDNYFIE